MSIFYRPEDSVAADFIPFYSQGRYHLFFLRDWRDPVKHGEGTPWWHLVTEDFVTFEDLGEALPRGPIGSQDVWVFTGCVIEHNGIFHIFYTGHNHHLAKIGRPQQGVLHATSPDLKVWTKDPDFAFFAPTENGYERDDWRDPFVFWDDEAEVWGMLLAARKTTGPARTRGCTAYATSPDLKTWTVQEPLWAPDQFFTHECPDLFKMGDWWYLVFSEFSDRKQTRYRMARNPHGPWITPADDALDTRAWYAAKSASDGRRRFFFGWLATRDGEKDDGGYQWGGNLVVHEVVQRPDGTLAAHIPDTVAAAFNTPQPLSLTPILGPWQEGSGSITTEAGGRNSTAILGKMPEECLIEATITVDAGVCSCAPVMTRTRTMRCALSRLANAS